jgi:hypothetical protein
VNPCAEFFAANCGADVAALLQHVPDAAAWEALSASPHSPGPVDGGERVVRVVYSPIHVDAQTGQLKPSVVDEASSRGCSVQREAHCPIPAVWDMGERIAAEKTAQEPAKPRAVQAVTVLAVAAVRALQAGGKRAVAVYDTALPDNIAHADVCVLTPGRQERRSARAQLFELALKGLQDARSRGLTQ